MGSRAARVGVATLVVILGSLCWVVVAGGTQPYETYETTVSTDGPAAQFRFSDAVGSKTIADSVGSYSATNTGITLGSTAKVTATQLAEKAWEYVAVASASGATDRHHAVSRCPTARSQVLAADSQAEVYAIREGSDEYLSVRACAYGQRHSLFVTTCNREEKAEACDGMLHVTLAGAIIAYEESFSTATRYTREGEPVSNAWRVIVRNLRTAKVLHRVPTGTPVTPKPTYVGVGNVVALVLTSDGSVAWIAEDNERSATGTPAEAVYFDVYAVDKSGTRLLAAGANVDPSSLALAVGDSNTGGYPHAVVGSTLYWTQDGASFAATLQ
jgi:hypothetical protein